MLLPPQKITVGAQSAIDGAHDLIGPTGTVVLVGMPPTGARAVFDPVMLADAGQRIVGSKLGGANIQTDIPYLVDLYRQGRLKLDELISGRYPLSGINDAMLDVARGNALRNLIVF